MNVVDASLSPSVGPALAPTTLSLSEGTALSATKRASVDEFPPSLGAAEAQTLLVSFACQAPADQRKCRSWTRHRDGRRRCRPS